MSAPLISQMGAEAMGAVIRWLSPNPNPYAREMHTNLLHLAADEARPQALTRWMKARNGQRVITFQATVDPRAGEVRNTWEPGDRIIDSTRATRVVFIDPYTGSTSERYYDRIRAIRSSDTTWVGYDESMHTLIVYTVVIP